MVDRGTQGAPAESTRARVKKSLAPDDCRHGTYNGYKHYGCRCDGCKAANSDYERERRRLGCDRPRAKHNRASYIDGCRCGVCREAHTAYKREWYRARARNVRFLGGSEGGG